ncbi:MAG: hypothetical protein HY812_03335 [Planctomycetes bacterium]|nr:hypothetical protein [Planctomycetota bacterium]
MAAKKKAKKGKRDMLVVGSKVKELVRGKGLMAAGDLLEAISERVHEIVDRAATRTQANRRSTMRPQDL